jgi:predicted nucleic acid-binding protein
LAEFICDTSPLQYLHQVGLIDILPALAGRIVVPPAVVAELAAGRARGLNVPDPTAETWIAVRAPASGPPIPSLVALGSGELEVLTLALETVDAVVILDDRLARQVAQVLGIPLTGTLGLLLDAKRAGLIAAVGPVLDSLQVLGFRIARQTRAAVLALAGETP